MENILGAVANFLGGGMLLCVGLALRFVKGSERLIAGYNMMSNAEQARWNAPEMTKFLGRALVISACWLIAAGVLASLGFYPDATLQVSWGLFVAGMLFCVVYLNVCGRFRERG